MTQPLPDFSILYQIFQILCAKYFNSSAHIVARDLSLDEIKERFLAAIAYRLVGDLTVAEYKERGD